MPVVTHTLELQSASESFPLVADMLPCVSENIPAHQGAAHNVAKEDWPTTLGVDEELLLLFLPESLEPELKALAESELDVYNCHSDDLLENRTVLALTTAAAVVEVDVWDTNFPRQGRRFYIALVAGDAVVLVRHDMDEEDEEAFCIGIQGACGSSGPNYRPYRQWSDEQLQTATEGRSPFAGANKAANGLQRVRCETLYKAKN